MWSLTQFPTLKCERYMLFIIYRINSRIFSLLDHLSSLSDTYSFHKTCYDDAHTKTCMPVMLCENMANIHIIVLHESFVPCIFHVHMLYV